MRGYSWTNMYLSSIQNGIQSWHANNEVLCKYEVGSMEFNVFMDWVRNHKTCIVLNGGYASNIRKIVHTFNALNERLKDNGESLPNACFHEDSDALDGALTAFFAVFPEDCYAKSDERSSIRYHLSRAKIKGDLMDLAIDFDNEDLSMAIRNAFGEDSIKNRFKMITCCGNTAS